MKNSKRLEGCKKNAFIHFKKKFKNNFGNGAIMHRIGPETPQFSGLLKTTCNDEDYDEFDLGFEVKIKLFSRNFYFYFCSLSFRKIN